MAFRIKDRTLSGFDRYRVTTEDIAPQMLFDVFNIHVPIGSGKTKIVKAALRTLSKAKTKFSYDFDGRHILVRMISEPGWIKIERLSNNH